MGGGRGEIIEWSRFCSLKSRKILCAFLGLFPGYRTKEEQKGIHTHSKTISPCKKNSFSLKIKWFGWKSCPGSYHHSIASLFRGQSFIAKVLIFCGCFQTTPNLFLLPEGERSNFCPSLGQGKMVKQMNLKPRDRITNEHPDQHQGWMLSWGQNHKSGFFFFYF